MQNDIPQQFYDRLEQIVPPEHFQQCIDSFIQPKMTSFRVNTLLSSPEQVEDALQSLKIPYRLLDELENVYLVDKHSRSALTESDLQNNGMIYIQNPSSMLAAIALNPQPGEEILDLTAAPGGKTLLMADLMKNQGRIAAVEAVKSRFFKLKNNVKTHGATIVDCYLKDGVLVGRKVPERFDRVLLDAPCSSESRFHVENPKSFAYWSDKKIKQMAKKQKKLLLSALNALKPGGTLVYCTCSFAPEENEAVIQWLLDKEKNVDILPLDLPIKNSQPGLTRWNDITFTPTLSLAHRTLPTQIWNGLFICKLRKQNRP